VSQTKKPLRYMAKLVIQHPGLAIQSIVLLSLMATVNLPLPILNKLAIDHAIPAGDPWPLVWLGLLAFVVRTTASGFQVLQNHVMWSLLGDITHGLRSRMARAILETETSLAAKGQLGSYVGRLSSDIESIERTIFDSFRFIVRPIAMIAVMVSVMFFVSWQVTMMILILTPMTVFLMRSLTAKLREQNKLVLSLREQMQSTVSEQLENIRVLRVNHGEGRARKTISDQAGEYGEASVAYATRQQFVQSLSEMLNFLPWLALVTVGAHLVHVGHMSTGDYLMFISFDQLLRSPVGQLCFYLLQLRAEMAAPERIEEVLSLPVEDLALTAEDSMIVPTMNSVQHVNESGKDSGKENGKDSGGNIQLQDIHFAYEGGSSIFSGLNLAIETGERVAIVGPSGAGKTTLISLLLGFNRPQSGSIFIGETTLKPGNFLRSRKNMGVVFQHNPMFDASLSENLKLNRSHLQEQDLWDALRRADLADFVTKRPDQLMTIAHRLSTILDSDRILYLDQGIVLESGSHEELMSLAGAYARLYELQFKKS
jgi:ATP-binding cassette subfamily B multidrug efflux pump